MKTQSYITILLFILGFQLAIKAQSDNCDTRLYDFNPDIQEREISFLPLLLLPLPWVRMAKKSARSTGCMGWVVTKDPGPVGMPIPSMVGAIPFRRT